MKDYEIAKSLLPRINWGNVPARRGARRLGEYRREAIRGSGARGNSGTGMHIPPAWTSGIGDLAQGR